MFAARRLIEAAQARKNGRALLLALDWKAAFDSIHPGALVVALVRFGVDDHVARLIGNIYQNRRFKVNDSGDMSQEKQQRSGISQGCPLSPFLFISLTGEGHKYNIQDPPPWPPSRPPSRPPACPAGGRRAGHWGQPPAAGAAHESPHKIHTKSHTYHQLNPAHKTDSTLHIYKPTGTICQNLGPVGEVSSIVYD